MLIEQLFKVWMPLSMQSFSWHYHRTIVSQCLQTLRTTDSVECGNLVYYNSSFERSSSGCLCFSDCMKQSIVLLSKVSALRRSKWKSHIFNHVLNYTNMDIVRRSVDGRKCIVTAKRSRPSSSLAGVRRWSSRRAFAATSSVKVFELVSKNINKQDNW